MIGGLFGGPAATRAGFSGLSNKSQPEKPKSWLDGGKLKGKDGVALALGLLGVGLGGQPILPQFLMQNMMQRRENEREQQMYDQRRQHGIEDYGKKLALQAQYQGKEPPTPGSYEWFQTATPDQIAQYTSYMDITRPVMATTWQGPQVVSRSSQGIGGMGQSAPETLPPGFFGN